MADAIEFHSEFEKPTQSGWYLVRSVDGRYGGESRYRGWGKECWWIPLKDGWIEGPTNVYQWHGPVADIEGPAPDGTNPVKTLEGDRNG